MSHFVLFNEANQEVLTHPQLGIWTAPTQEDAEKLLSRCLAFVKSAGYDFLEGKIKVMEIDELPA